MCIAVRVRPGLPFGLVAESRAASPRLLENGATARGTGGEPALSETGASGSAGLSGILGTAGVPGVCWRGMGEALLEPIRRRCEAGVLNATGLGWARFLVDDLGTVPPNISLSGEVAMGENCW